MYFMPIMRGELFQFEYIKNLKMDESCAIKCELLSMTNIEKKGTFIHYLFTF